MRSKEAKRIAGARLAKEFPADKREKVYGFHQTVNQLVACILMGHENAILMKMRQVMKQHDIDISILMFDGALVYKKQGGSIVPKETMERVCREMEASIQSAWHMDIQMEMKPLKDTHPFFRNNAEVKKTCEGMRQNTFRIYDKGQLRWRNRPQKIKAGGGGESWLASAVKRFVNWLA